MSGTMVRVTVHRSRRIGYSLALHLEDDGFSIRVVDCSIKVFDFLLAF